MTETGRIVVLNGVPRSGKTSIASAMQATFDGVWLNLGVDAFSRGVTPPQYLPGLGLRPGGERPDLEPVVSILFDALFDAVLVQSRVGTNVVVDIGLHDDYSTSLGILRRTSPRLEAHSAFFIGVRCPLPVIMDRRGTPEPGQDGSYLERRPDGSIPDPVLRWERAVHRPGIYDLEVDTAQGTPGECAAAIGARIDRGPPSAFREITERYRGA